ncbi:unnamed protein product [Closterium sp. Yama58-4]|nr:unnamed protein product [Closterium sp. Yama58-4]
MKATSDGVWTGEKPIDYALPLLIIQLCLIAVFSRTFAIILKPLRQPRVIAEMLGGIVLGSSCMGYIPGFTDAIFPKDSLTVLTTIANVGLLYFLFTVGLELDMRSIAKTGRTAMIIAVVGICVPFALGIGTSFALRQVLQVDSAFGPFVVFMGVAMSITAFPVLARILAERKMLTTDVGQMAMSAAAVDDITAWVLLALAVALSTPDASPIVALWILLCGVAFVVVMFVAVRPMMAWIARRVTPGEPVPEWIVGVVLVGVLLCGFVTDTIGIHGIFGAFIFGLVLPKDGPLPSLVMEKIEDFTSIILLPLYFASSGLAVKFQSISGAAAVGMIFLVIGTACVGKIGGIMSSAMIAGLPMRKSLVLGVLMNTKGLVELIVLNIGLSKKVITQEIYSIMVIMALVTTFMTTPLVMMLYKPARRKLPHTTKVEELAMVNGELRLLVCVHGMKNLPAMLNLTEVSRGTRKRPLRVFLMHLMELSERSSAIMMVTRVRRDGRPYWSKESEQAGRDQVVVAFQAYSQLSRVNVQPLTAISKFDNMHEDICITAADRRSNLIVVPYHKFMTPDGSMEAVHPGFQMVTRRVLRAAPCSVAILVDRGFGGFSHLSPTAVSYRIAVLFFGGPDDREALTVARRMEEHPGVSFSVVRFVATEEVELGFVVAQQEQHSLVHASGSGSGHGHAHKGGDKTVSFLVPVDKVEVDRERELDDSALAPIIDKARQEEALAAKEAAAEASVDGEGGEGGVGASGSVRKRRMVYEERQVEDPVAALTAASLDDYDLVIVGRGRRSTALVAQIAAQRTPFRSYFHGPAAMHLGRFGHSGGSSHEGGSELGPVGDMLVEMEGKASILVVQQHDPHLMRSSHQVADINMLMTVSRDAQDTPAADAVREQPVEARSGIEEV